MNKKRYLLEVLLNFIFFSFLFFLFLETVEAERYGVNVEELKDSNKNEHSEDELFLSFENVQYRRINEGLIITIQGATNLPDGASIYIFLKRKKSFIAGKEVCVRNGLFDIELGPFVKEFYPGIYTIEAFFIHCRQSKEVLKVVDQRCITDERLINYSLQIGETKQIKEVQSRVRGKIESLIEQLQRLYEDADNMYKKHCEKGFNEYEWCCWSKKWQGELKELDRLNKMRNNGKIVALWPKLEEGLSETVYLVRLLERLYLRKLEGKEDLKQTISAEEARSIIPRKLSLIKNRLEIDFIEENPDVFRLNY